MKIGIIAPPWIPIPPPKYGGTEMVVYNLVEGLTALRQKVVLFASQESNVSCSVRAYIESGTYLGLDTPLRTKILASELTSKFAFAQAAYEKVDIIHSHSMDAPDVNVPTVYTLHGPANEDSVNKCEELSRNPGNSFVSISRRQQELFLGMNKNIRFSGNVHNCINAKSVEWKKKKEDFFLFVGRVNWEKGLDLAIRVASKAGVNLIMAVKMTEDFEKEFFRKEILPWIEKYPQHLFFQFQKELPRKMIFDLIKRARCTLFTSQWEEPFGLVMIESMACGTPVIALRRGAAPEVIINGKTGYVVDSEDDMVEIIKQGKIDKIKPQDCRRHAERNFSRVKMVSDYLEIYKKILNNQ